MPYEIFLALRYLRTRRKRHLARVTAVAAVSGISMGVGALIVALALSNGFRDEMRDKILAGTAHLSVLRTDGRAIGNDETAVARIRKVDGVVSAFVTTYDGALASGPKGATYAVLRGLARPAEEAAVPQHWILQGSLEPIFEAEQAGKNEMPGVVVGDQLATRLGLGINDVFQVIPANTAGFQVTAATRRLRVCGIFRSGLYEYDSTWIYLSLASAATFLSGDHVASVISVRIKNADDVKRISQEVRTNLGAGYTTVDWQEANQPLFAALALERRMGLFIIGLIIVIAAINITTMLILVVVERRRDIAILSALGATRSGVMLLFVIEGAAIGAIGAIAGVALGLVACVLGNHYKLVSLPPDVYSISNVPFNAHATEVLFAALIAFLLSVAATIYPARAAAQMRPVETLRDV